MKNNDQETKETAKILVTLARTAERPKQLKVSENATVREVLAAAEIELEEGDVIERMGQVLTSEDVVKPEDVLFITEDDDNGVA